MVDRYAAGALRRYCEVRRLSPAQARAELALFEHLVLFRGLRAAEAGSCVGAGRRHAARRTFRFAPGSLKEHAVWTT